MLNRSSVSTPFSAASARHPIIILEGLERTHVSGNAVFHAIGGISLQIQLGEFVAIMGPS
jgi:ABC-type dipeptide/oligopeptide/nickel transport system ATPase subunit